MLELWLNFTDPDGATRRVKVTGSKFVIGRHSDCDLAISDARLSRVHATIERFGDIWEVSDAGSSNGTTLNGSPVFDAVPLANGHTLSLGGLPVTVEIVAEVPTAAASIAASVSPSSSGEKPVKAKDSNGPRRIPVGLIFLPPILALFLVLFGGGIAYFVTAGDPLTAKNSVPGDDDDPPVNNKNNRDDDDPPIPQDTATPDSITSTPTPTSLSETAKVELNGANFLRKIAQNDSNIFLTTDQAKRVQSKIRSLQSSSAVAANLRSAKQNAAQIRTLASERSLKPQLLAVAAVARLGTKTGDVVATAKTMAEVLEKLNIQIGSELADDCLLMIAAYEQGAAGETMKMRNMLQALANETNESSRTIRTIWFLEKRGKITPAEFERALAFLAIGTIAQNPKDFDVNTEALDI